MVGPDDRVDGLGQVVVGWSLVLLAIMVAIVVLQATPVLSWMVP